MADEKKFKYEVGVPTEEIVQKAKRLYEWLMANTDGPKEGAGVLAMVAVVLKETTGWGAEAALIDSQGGERLNVQAKGEA